MVKFWRAPAHWPDETAFIVASGPSLQGRDLAGLAGRRVITINNSFRLVESPSVIFFADTQWWRWHGKDVPVEAPDTKVVTTASASHRFLAPNVLRMGRDYRYEFRGRDPSQIVSLSDDPCLLSGPDSGSMAINLAYHFGVSRIVLLGYDMSFPGGQSHWHEEHPTPSKEHNYTNLFAPTYPGLIAALGKRGVEVIRATPSALDFIPEVRLDAALALPDRRRKN